MSSIGVRPDQAFSLAVESARSFRKVVAVCVVALSVPNKGHGGVSASACAIFDEAGKQIAKDVKTSRAANRQQWHAHIKAVRLALELARDGDDLIAYVTLNSISDGFNQGFRSANGGRMEDFVSGTEVIEFAKQRNIKLAVRYAPKAQVAATLQKEAKAAAKARLADLGDDAVSPSIPPVWGEEKGDFSV